MPVAEQHPGTTLSRVRPLRRFAVDHRLERRFFCWGQVLLNLGEPAGELRGELIDVSAHGFRVSLFQPVLTVGAELEFKHKFSQGRARVMWIRPVRNHFEAGCMALRK